VWATPGESPESIEHLIGSNFAPTPWTAVVNHPDAITERGLTSLALATLSIVL
jgi:hypothetical protein